MRDHVVIEQLEISLTEVAIAAPPNRILGERVDDNVFVLRAAAGMDAGLGAEGAALHERAFTISHRVLHQNGVGQIPMSAGEILETELIGAIRAVPHTRFYHLKPPLWPLGAAASRLLACRLDRRFSWRFLAPQGAAPSGRPLCTNPPRRQALRPYIQPLRVCQAVEIPSGARHHRSQGPIRLDRARSPATAPLEHLITLLRRARLRRRDRYSYGKPRSLRFRADRGRRKYRS